MSHCPNCDELQRFLSETLPPDRELEVAAHFDQCEHCQRDAESLVNCGSLDAARAAIANKTGEEATRQPHVAVLNSLQRLAAPRAGDQQVPACGTALPANIGDYRVTRLLAPGSTGAVYLATQSPDTDPQDLVAIKLLAPECVERPLHRKRFERERNALAELPAHPHVVRVLDSCLSDETRFLVMEYAGGQNLWQKVINQPQMEIDQACQFVVQAASGLQHIHSHGLIHRDIKPSNLITDEQGNLKIVDFGIVHHAEVEQLESRLTEKNALIGTADFMAPEQAMDVHSVGPQADIYSLGCTLAWLLTGSLLFERKSVPETLMAHRRTPPPSLRERRSDIPPKLDALFQKMVSKEPDDRPASMDQVIEEIQSVIAALTASGSVLGIANCVEDQEIEPVEGPGLGRTGMRLAVFVAVLVVVAAAFFALR